MKTNRTAILFFASVLFAESPILTVTVPPRLAAKPGETIDSTLAVHIAPGFHANSNSPADPFLIPLSLAWPSGSFESQNVSFPKPEIRKLGFSEKPASIFSGEFEIVTRFHVVSSAQPGATTLTGKLHYQACDDHSCRPPATVSVTLPVEIAK